MRLSVLFPSEKIKNSDEVDNITFDSREVDKGSLFFAIPGEAKDGHDFIEQVIQQGAIALVVSDIDRVPISYSGTVIVSKAPRYELGRVAKLFYGAPDEKLKCLAVTGTNGKTSTVNILEHLFNEASLPIGVMGTLGHRLGSREWESQHTTSDAKSLYHRLREFLNLGAKSVALEASSHALDQFRLGPIDLDIGIFTNLTRDHLDYHLSMENYFLAKEKLFTDLLGNSKKKNKCAVINEDDPWASKIVLGKNIRRLGFGKNNGNHLFRVLDQSLFGSEFELEIGGNYQKFFVPMVGHHNVYNAVGSILAAWHTGLSLSGIAFNLKMFPGVAGRLQKINMDQKKYPAVFVDYAHTNDALESSINSLSELRGVGSKLICVFGCGGDRDKGKRPLMGRVAVDNCDQVYVTSDNPRTESMDTIIDDIIEGVPSESMGSVHREKDREKAIFAAINAASEGDIVLVAGKGHETYQIIGEVTHDFDDSTVVKRALSQWLKQGSGAK